ncbi:hypothetical protein DFP72DRAFT_1087093 [Ephemerocybe angulata]|uniref:Uncharacterized protein n=1 Tax=Ephemerocybe angulata TaxID=980116 RepID=A0A8H6H5E7_9AGAR|nr:hypothetical protein DFP72DRAFT_1087093 [Tulosesus angulatus]
MDQQFPLAQVINAEMVRQHGFDQSPAVVELLKAYIRGLWTELDGHEKFELLKAQPLRTLKHLEKERDIGRDELEVVVESQLKDRLQEFGLDFDPVMKLLDDHSAYITGHFTLSLIDGGYKSNEIDFHIPAVNTGKFIDSMIGMGFSELDKEESGEGKGHGLVVDSDEDRKDSQWLFQFNSLGQHVRKDDHEPVDCHIPDGPHARGRYHLINAAGKRANVISCEKHALVSIAHFHSTVSMNYIAHHGLVLLYSDLTLDRIGLSNGGPWDMEPHAEQAIQKYKDKGYTITAVYDNEDHTCGGDPSCPQTIRSLQDVGVWHLRWNTFRSTRTRQIRAYRDARKFIWQLSGGDWCRGAGGEGTGMVMVNRHCEVIRNHADRERVIRMAEDL